MVTPLHRSVSHDRVTGRTYIGLLGLVLHKSKSCLLTWREFEDADLVGIRVKKEYLLWFQVDAPESTSGDGANWSPFHPHLSETRTGHLWV